MKKIVIALWVIILPLTSSAFLTAAQEQPPCDSSVFSQIDAALTEAQASLSNGDTAKAGELLSSAQTLAASCTGASESGGATAPVSNTVVTSNAEWTPVIQEFDGVPMVQVPAGCFTMGSTDEQLSYLATLGGDKGNYASEQPAVEVCFEQGFWIDQYEVTNAQFEQLGGAAATRSYWQGAQQPREQITWFEARDFCAKRGGRLPSEAEWEYASRGPDSLTYAWGNEFIADNVYYNKNAGGQTNNVGGRAEGISWTGAYDMNGNTWEWTSSIDKPYPYDAADGREDANDMESPRVLRSGSWYSASLFVHSAYRYRDVPTSQNNYRGFRCARSE